MIMAAKVALGILYNAPVSSYRPMITAAAVASPPRGLLTPESEITALRDIPPPIGIVKKIPLTKFEMPRKHSSWLSSMTYPFRRPNALAMARCSIERYVSQMLLGFSDVTTYYLVIAVSVSRLNNKSHVGNREHAHES